MRRLLFALVAVVAIATPVQLHADGPDFSAFAGPWYHHAGASFAVDASGVVWVTLGSYLNPQHSPPETLAQLDTVDGDTAYGQYTRDGAAFWMTVIPAWDVVIMSSDGMAPWTVLCGDHVPQTLFRQLQQAGLAGASGCGT